MIFSIRFKVFATLLLAMVLVVLGMYFFMRWSFEQGFTHLAEERQQGRVQALITRLAEAQTQDPGWQRLRNDRLRWTRLLLGDRGRRRIPPSWLISAPSDPPSWWPPTSPEKDRHREFRPLELRVMLLDANRQVLVGQPDASARLRLYPIEVEGDTLGYLGVLPGIPFGELAEARFIEQQGRSFIWIAVAMLGLCAALGLPLAYTLVSPLRRITDAAQALAGGNYATRVEVQTRDELAQLAGHVNGLASALERTEQARRDWMADISHELRTPVALLRGELEAVQDGVRPLSPATVAALHGDVMRLHRLVEDLYQLSLSDAGALQYRREPVDLVAVLEADLHALDQEWDARQLELHYMNRLPGPALLEGDADRLSQLFRNLLTNALRYTAPGGRVEVILEAAPGALRLLVQDSAPGVPDAALEQLFQRFYRVEASRNRASGGAGLGLAIARNIALAHQATIGARHSPLGGLCVQVEWPLKR